MKEIGDLVCGFAPRLIVVPISHKALDQTVEHLPERRS